MLLGLLVLAAVALALPVLTGLGDRRRGHGPAHVLIAGLFFPVTWAVWYVRDEQPYQRAGAH
ncbi:MAG TPA: hypothetical protein VMF51_02935 [Nocardioides sp.]|uniref:hypothetical protein n=1 Tax=Nocardioides sp. TaxID=35761 RepID=UPI002BF7A3E3|nr:hypothetical protein [Nocardioides sp.]HTW14054.1 hypothetical protein [Nocardioides sp.]